MKPNYLLKTSLSILLLATSSRVFAQDFKPSDDPKLQTIGFTVTEDNAWTDIFKRTKGWFGADGIFSIPMDGVDSIGAAKNQTTFFVFSDSLIGEVVGHKAKNMEMPRNTVAYIKGNVPTAEGIKFYWGTDSKGKAESIFKPQTSQSKPGDYFWMGDGFVDKALNNTIYVFGHRMMTDKARGIPFAQVGSVLIAIPHNSKPPFKDQRQMDTPLFFEMGPKDNGFFGAAILNNSADAKLPNADGYVYVYGVHGRKSNVVVGRVKPEDFEQFDKWTFFDGNGWDKDVKHVATIADHTSNEMSVTPLPNGLYAMVFQLDGVSHILGMRLGKTPYGPFGPVINVYNTDRYHGKVITYNAKAHPSLSNSGELLISYNVNFTDFFNQLNVSPDIYRPRFIRVKFDSK